MTTPYRELRYAMVEEGIEPKCLGEEPSYIDYPPHSVPNMAMAAELCRGCPLLELCDEAARAKKPAWGVWAGQVYGGNVRS